MLPGRNTRPGGAGSFASRRPHSRSPAQSASALQSPSPTPPVRKIAELSEGMSYFLD